jgi:hypothetical protein
MLPTYSYSTPTGRARRPHARSVTLWRKLVDEPELVVYRYEAPRVGHWAEVAREEGTFRRCVIGSHKRKLTWVSIAETRNLQTAEMRAFKVLLATARPNRIR